MKTTSAKRLSVAIKTMVAIGLAVTSVNSFAFINYFVSGFHSFFFDNGYVGNPSRPQTIWVPPHYVNGCWVEGYYVKFLTHITTADLVWVDSPAYWFFLPTAHWELRH